MPTYRKALACSDPLLDGEDFLVDGRAALVLLLDSYVAGKVRPCWQRRQLPRIVSLSGPVLGAGIGLLAVRGIPMAGCHLAED